MKRKSDVLEKTASPEEAAKGAAEWQRLEDEERVAMLRQIRAARKQDQQELAG